MQAISVQVGAPTDDPSMTPMEALTCMLRNPGIQAISFPHVDAWGVDCTLLKKDTVLRIDGHPKTVTVTETRWFPFKTLGAFVPVERIAGEGAIRDAWIRDKNKRDNFMENMWKPFGDIVGILESDDGRDTLPIEELLLV